MEGKGILFFTVLSTINIPHFHSLLEWGYSSLGSSPHPLGRIRSETKSLFVSKGKFGTDDWSLIP